MIERFVRMAQTLDRINGTPPLPPEDPLVAPTMNFDDESSRSHVQTAGGGNLGTQRWGASFRGSTDYSGQSAPGTNAADDGPLLAPTMSFDDTHSHSAVGPTANHDQEREGQDEDGPLVAPKMKF